MELGCVELVVGGPEEQLKATRLVQGIVQEVEAFLKLEVVGLEDGGVDALEGYLFDYPGHGGVLR